MPDTLRTLLYRPFTRVVLTLLLFQVAATSNLVAAAGHLPFQETEIQHIATERDEATQFLFTGETPKTADQLRVIEQQSRDIAPRVIEATVNIQVGAAQGSGVIVTDDGYILTAAHVIGRPNLRAVVTLSDGRRLRATTLGVNRAVDSGMLKIDEEGTWPYLEIGESGPLVRGQWVIAIGHPGGIDEKRGLVLRVGRLLNSLETQMKSDCVLVGGDSGGPLVDFEGRVIGIHSRISTSVWDNIHVPIDTFSNDWDQLIAKKIVGAQPRKLIGFSLGAKGNTVTRVEEGSPAAEAGLKVGDQVIKANDQPVTNSGDFQKIYSAIDIGDVIKLTVKRGEEELVLNLTVGEQ